MWPSFGICFLSLIHLHTLDLEFDRTVDIGLEARALSQCKSLISVHPVTPHSFQDVLILLDALISSTSRPLIQDFGFLALYSYARNVLLLSPPQMELFAHKLSCFPALTVLYSSDLVPPQQLHFISVAVPQLRSLILACYLSTPESFLDLVPVALSHFPSLRCLDATLVINGSKKFDEEQRFDRMKEEVHATVSAARPSLSLTVHLSVQYAFP